MREEADMSRICTVLAALCVAAGAWLSGTTAQDADGTFSWMTDLDAARVKAKAEGKPLLVVFR